MQNVERQLVKDSRVPENIKYRSTKAHSRLPFLPALFVMIHARKAGSILPHIYH